MKLTFYSNGKLLLSGEYAVLDGALALAMPTKFGQYLHVETTDSPEIQWTSLDEEDNIWFQGTYSLKTLKIQQNKAAHQKVAETLGHILSVASKQNSKFLHGEKGFAVTSKLTFPRDWGLGSSSTLVNNIAQWAAIDPYQLLSDTFGGSGYDIACANRNTPIVYQLVNKRPETREIDFNPTFKDNLFFIFLNQKQDSRKAIANYRMQRFDQLQLTQELSELTNRMVNADHLKEFELSISEHEQLLSKILRMEPIQSKLFSDYWGSIKSLGGWGGDFVLATGNEKTPGYFKTKGFHTVFRYADMAL